MMEFFCPYCKLWITDTVHAQHFHHEDEDGECDEIRDWRVRVDGVVYDDEETYYLGFTPATAREVKRRMTTTGTESE